MGATAELGRTLCRAAFRSVPPAALRVDHEDRVDYVIANGDARTSHDRLTCSSRIANAISLRSTPHSRAFGSPAAAAVESFPYAPNFECAELGPDPDPTPRA
jgi:hypothetical protein